MNRSLDDRDRNPSSADEMKPVFLSKAEREKREKLAIQQRKKEIAEIRRALEQLQQRSRPISSTEPSSTAPDDNYEKQAEREKVFEAFKEQYLGLKKPKKRVIKPSSEKFRFSFDWDNTEDTSRDVNALYQNPHEARPLFQPGFRFLMERREEKKLAARNEIQLLSSDSE